MKYIRNFIGIAIFLFLLATNILSAKNDSKPDTPAGINLYRSKHISVVDIYKEYGNELNLISDLYHPASQMNLEKNRTLQTQLLNRILSGIFAKGHFLYVQVGPVYYPDDEQVCFNIDVVDKEDKDRLSHFLPVPDKDKGDPDHLIETWIKYQTEGLRLMFEKTPPLFKSCPAFHCVYGFEQPTLQKYKQIFNELVPKHKLKLIEILRYDKSKEKRAAAAFLLAHLKNGSEIVKILSSSMFDSDSDVRNNVMRVLGETLTHVKIKDFPIANLEKILDFPSGSDRNKGLYILDSLANHAVYANYIAKHMTKQLVIFLRSVQPNINEIAYGILNKISGKNYSERDYVKWEQWVDANNRLHNT